MQITENKEEADTFLVAYLHEYFILKLFKYKLYFRLTVVIIILLSKAIYEVQNKVIYLTNVRLHF